MDALFQHICDTVREWQMKIGYREERMKLYYPQESLISMLGLPKDVSKETLDGELKAHLQGRNAELGETLISEQNGRYCLDLSAEGCRWIYENIPEPEFLKAFLEVITTPGKTMEDVRRVFGAYDPDYHEADHAHDGVEMGHVFRMEREDVDPYVYCVEEDDFGMTYHRFNKEDYLRTESGHV